MSKKVFLIVTIGLLLILGTFKTVSAEDLLGCCITKDPDALYCTSDVSKTEGCGSSMIVWEAGPCPSKCQNVEKNAGNLSVENNSITEGCKPNGQGEEKCQLENPIGRGVQGTTEVADIIKQIITVALGIIGAFTLLMLVWGGFQWLTSAGNPEKVSAGTQTMVWAVIGVLVVFASYMLLSTFLNFLTGG